MDGFPSVGFWASKAKKRQSIVLVNGRKESKAILWAQLNKAVKKKVSPFAKQRGLACNL
jgi:hypothetical protein